MNDRERCGDYDSALRMQWTDPQARAKAQLRLSTLTLKRCDAAVWNSVNSRPFLSQLVHDTRYGILLTLDQIIIIIIIIIIINEDGINVIGVATLNAQRSVSGMLVIAGQTAEMMKSKT
jgi:hypothetical protein